MDCVYCFQVGLSACFKVGRSKNPAHKRLKDVAVGSPHKLILYKEIRTDHASRLENYIHRLLDPWRAANGEFFNVTTQALDSAIVQAQALLVEATPILHEVKKFQRSKPTSDVLEPSEDVLILHRELREAWRQSFLLERRIEILQSRLQLAIGENLGISGVASWGWTDKRILNQALLKKEEPELYEKYQKLSSSRVFLLE